ncbi:alpha/beta hydrolase [Sinorhizobium sp. 7-81]|uniref:alpha/beta fold hydrolase n=1 Tax=Sinorhizobium sp. 8-89 TaxID=3049089 RepID=UPI0024C2AD14|nr:alpha/beta hydrolase [Sinorhizobium sp. 8-89]MDK1494093.1 alpha/beta hydrolase [Sinorhizobium sp. 8-89]
MRALMCRVILVGCNRAHATRSDGLNIAYQTIGDGPLDIIYVPGWVSNLDHAWIFPPLAHVFERLSAFSRLILFDKRGTGLSDRNVGFPTLEERMRDMQAVLDAAGSRRAALMGTSEGGHPIAEELMFCAPAYPEERANDMLPRWRDYMAWAPEEVSGLAESSTIPRDPAYPEYTWGKRVVTLATVYGGPAEEGVRVTRPLRGFGEPLLDFSGRMPYRALQSIYDGLFPTGRDRCYWKSTYLAGLDNGAIADIATRMAKRPSEKTFASIWKFGGAVQRVAADATAFGDRSMPIMLSLDAIWSDPANDDPNIGWVRDVWRHAALFHRSPVSELSGIW